MPGVGTRIFPCLTIVALLLEEIDRSRDATGAGVKIGTADGNSSQRKHLGFDNTTSDERIERIQGRLGRGFIARRFRQNPRHPMWCSLR